MKRFIRNYLSFSMRERIGILSLLFMVILLKSIPYFLEERSLTPMKEAMEQLREKLKEPLTAKETEDEHVYREASAPSLPLPGSAFNPNYIDEKEWMRRGVNEKLAGRIVKYRASGAVFRSVADLSRVYGFPKELLSKLEKQMLFDAPDKALKPEERFAQERTKLLEINSADSSQLEKLPGLGAYSVRKILQYRQRLGGFYRKEQLLEIKAINPGNFEIFSSMIIADSNQIQRIKINTASAYELSGHPYISRSQAEAIVNYRSQHGKFKAEEELTKVPLFSPEELEKLRRYLEYD